MHGNLHLDRRAEKLLLEKINDDRLLTTSECAEWLAVSYQWLDIGRIKGYGPPFRKLAPKIVRYYPPEVRDWLKERASIASSHPKRKTAATAATRAVVPPRERLRLKSNRS
jgi:predicted DNA-binding transcriptional regulator AlpA